MQELSRKWLSPLKDQCVKMDNEYKDAHDKVFSDISALISYQYKLSNIMNARCYLINMKVPKGIPTPVLCAQLNAETLCPETRTVFQISNRFVETLIKFIDSYRMRNVCIDIQRHHDAFFQMLVNRNAWFVRNKNLIPSYPKFQDLKIMTELEKPIRKEDEFTREIQKVFILSDKRDSVKFDSSFTPSVRTLSYLQAEIDQNKPLAEEIDRLMEDLNKTRIELIKEKTTLQREQNRTNEFLHNLPAQTINESRLYQDFVRSAKELLPEVRKNINGLIDPLEKVAGLLKIINESLKYAMPLNEIFNQEKDHLTAEYVKQSTNLQKLKLFQKLISDARIEPYSPNQAEIFIAYEKDVIESITKALNNSRFDEIARRIESAMEQFSQYEKTIPEETERFKRNSNAATNNMQHWNSSRPKHDLTELRSRVASLSQRINAQTNQTKIHIQNCLEMHNRTVEACRFMEPIKDGFQNEISVASEQEAHRRWLQNRIQERRKIVSEKKAQLEQAKKELQQVNEFSVKKDKEIAELMEAKKNKVPVQKRVAANFEEYEEKYHCPLCQTNKRSVFIAECGHTFCKECIDKQIKSRNRNCSTCGKRFDKSHVYEINFGSS